MRLTTDANDTITLGEIIRGHEKQLRERIAKADKKGGSAGVLEADRLLTRLQKLSQQADAIGFKLDGSRKPQSKLEELREILRQAGRDV